jgi:hypothetical protein
VAELSLSIVVEIFAIYKSRCIHADRDGCRENGDGEQFTLSPFYVEIGDNLKCSLPPFSETESPRERLSVLTVKPHPVSGRSDRAEKR